VSLKRSCSLWGALYVVCAVFVGHLVWRRFPKIPPAAISGAIGGGIVWMGLAYLAGVRTKLAEAARLRGGAGTRPDARLRRLRRVEAEVELVEERMREAVGVGD
jgi:hypothetical protein